MIKKISLILVFGLLNLVLSAQDIHLQSLKSNSNIIEYRRNLPKQNKTQLNNRTQSTSTLSLTLPFYDDFSYAGPYPDSTKWQHSQSVYVNHTKAIAPPTLGVATFDGLNKYGYPYNSAVTSGQANQPGQASDTLTSQPIRLDSLGGIGFSPADSIFLSFYFEARGYWDKPESGDELQLDFYSPVDTTWSQVWSHSGYQYDPDSTWHIVTIPVLDPNYFKKNFQFRFRNLSSGSGDVDHWHIDVVSLKTYPLGRDTIFPDHSFVYDLPSTLKNYTQMPFRQYTGANDMKTNIHAFLRNNDNNILHENVSTGYNCYDNRAGNLLYATSTTSPPATNLGYYYNNGYCTAPSVINPSLNFSYPSMADSNTFTMKFYLLGQQDQHPANDTISFQQKFSNYYSYDDGSAETGFNFGSSTGIGNYKMAVRYTLTNADTLQAMDIFFDPMTDVNLIKGAPFNILVWSDNAGLPGSVIYTDSMHYPYFPADLANQGVSQRENNFLRYQFKHPVYLNGGTTFYLGINQIYAAPQITIGFDMNTDFHRNMFYNSNGNNWYVFPGDLDVDYRGSVMLHPVFGDSLETLSIKDYTVKNTASIKLYPNPASDYVSIQCDHTISKIVVSDLLGNSILQQTADSIKNINTLALQSGVYLVKAITNKGFTDTQKLIIAK